MDWNHMDYLLTIFINCLDSHSDGTHSLQMIHWWASDVMQNFIKSVAYEATNIMKQVMFILGVTYCHCKEVLYLLLNCYKQAE